MPITATATSLDVNGKLTGAQYARVCELLDRPPGRHKAWARFYTFGELGRGQAETLAEYLRAERVSYTIETAKTWTPGA